MLFERLGWLIAVLLGVFVRPVADRVVRPGPQRACGPLESSE